MKSFYNIISIFLVFLYIAGVILGVYLLTYDAAKTQKVMVLFPQLIYLTIALSLVGLCGFLFLFLKREGSVEIIYTVANGNQQIIEDTKGKHLDNNDQNEQTAIVKAIWAKLKQEAAAQNVSIAEQALRAICQHLEVGIGAMYVAKGNMMELTAAYALYRAEDEIIQYQLGEGLVGQVARDGKPIKISQIPEGYMEVVSGLGNAFPNFLTLFPIKNLNQDVKAVIELATFKDIGGQELVFLEEMALLLAREI